MTISTNVLLSIIIPTHDRWDMLSELLGTIPDREDVEVVVVDDHSAEVRDIDSPFSRTTLRLLRAPAGQRYAGMARNQALDAAGGRFLFFADSDDKIETRAFGRALDYLEVFGGDVLYGFLSSFDAASCMPGSRHLAANWLIDQFRETSDTDFLFRMHVPYGKFIRRDFVESHGLRFGATRVSNDVLFNLDLVRRKPSAEVFDAAVYSVRQGHDSLTSNTTRDTLMVRLDVLNAYNSGLVEAGKPHLRSPATGYIRKALRVEPSMVPAMMIRAWKGNTPLLPPIWTLHNSLARKMHQAS